MAVTTLLPDSLAESVKEAVKSTATCSASTVSSLQLLLRSVTDNSRASSRAANRSKTTTVTSTVTRTKSTRSVNPRIAAKVAVFQATTEVEDWGAHLSQQEKLVLATEVFNATSKALSDALQRNASPKTPLQPTSPNRIIAPSAKSKASKDTLATIVNAEEGVLAVAECSRLALSSLRSIKTEKPGENTHPNLQLEQGTCVLVGRLIALGLNDLAYKELRALKKRLQQYMQKATDGGKPNKIDPTSEGREEHDAEKETLADLLSFSHLENSKPLLTVLILFQTNALKFILAERKASVLEKMCNPLALSNPSSPANIIVNAVQAGSLTKDKAALQLLSLSNTISSLSLLAQRSSGTSSTKPQKRPVSTLVLQLLSLEIRTMSWNLSGHVSDSKREFWDPLVRSLETFAVNGGGKLEKADFAMIYQSVHRSQSVMAKDQGKVSTDGRATISWKIAFALGKVAQDSSCFEEALKLFSSAVNSPIGEQPLSFSSIHCRISFIHLHRQRLTKDYPTFLVSQSLLDAASGLKSSNKGSNSDLEELLIESAKLKKLAMACLGESLSSAGSKTELEEPTTGYLHAYIRFLRRYVGRSSIDDSDSKDSEQLQQILHKSKNIILTAVDSTVALAKMSVLRQAPSWNNVQPILSDCKRLLKALENLTDKEPSDDDNWRTSLVKLSNVYWSRYLKEKESGKDFTELIPLLEQATGILQNCPASDRAAGFAALKLERLSYLYSEARMGTKSAATLQRSIQEHIDSGSLQEFSTSLSGRPPHVLFHSTQNPGFTLSRVLSTYLNLQMRRKEPAEQTILNNRSLRSEERGIFLEWQMGLLMEAHQRHESDKESFRSLFQNLISELLSLYSMEHYSTRRFRVTLHMLRFAHEHPHAIDCAIVDSLVKDATSNLSIDQELALDTDLEKFSSHVRNSLHLVLLFRDGSSNAEDLQRILSSWASIVQKCPDWESVEMFVDDPEYWISQIKAAADYMEARGLQQLHLTATALLIRVMELQATKDISSIVLNLSRCALQYCRLGNCKGCLSLLDRAGYYTNNHNNVSCYALVTYHLVRTEYFLESGDPANAENTLSNAQRIYESRLPETELSGRSKAAWERVVVDGTLLCSRIAHVKGSLRSALYFAKLSVRLSTRLWTKLERLSGKKRESEPIAKEQSDIDMVIDGVANIDISGVPASPTWSYSEGAVFWSHVASHHACLLNLMRLSAHNGLFQDAIYYGEQALKVNKSFGASARSIACQAELGLEWIRGDRISDAKELLSAATALSESLGNSIEIVTLKTSLAMLSKAQGHHDDVTGLLQDAYRSLTQLSEGQVTASLLTTGMELGIEQSMDNMKIRRTAIKKETDTATARRPRRTKAPSKGASKTDEESEQRSASVESRSILLLKTEIVRQQVHSLLATQEFDEALRLLNMAKQYSLPVKNQISLQIDEVEHILADTIRSVATHAVYCVLSESTLSLPSVKHLKLISDGNVDATKSSASKRSAPASKRHRAPVKETRSRTPRVVKEDVNIASTMSKAKTAIGETVRNAAAFGSTVEGHAAAGLMGRVSMLLHATAPGLVDQDILTPANANEVGRITAFERERLAIDIDKQLSGCPDSMKWPISMNSDLAANSDIVTSFTEDYIDILPPSWNVLSVSLNVDRTEFVISKMCRGRTPFLLRLPLKRGNEEDEEDEDEFTFATGKQEMKEIIKLANASAHDAKSRVDRNSRKEWWATRESLDRRLETLLSNIENIWLGGFRGIFSATARDSESLLCFAAAFETVLDKHLPSRRKAGNKSEMIKLHENVLELFVGLRDLDNQENPEDSLMDLLYFVVDILQFQGERNAYDEIDFDMMVVDTLDALKAHDEASRTTADCVRPNHTILILDKSLHSFPWESLPCLQGLPVSRIPSLECLRTRVLQFTPKQNDESHEFAIDRRNGSFILNPSGDLKTTQSTFEEELSNMEGWSSIVNRPPTEEEFQSALQDKSLFLYFGHGSGAQYIRGRTIKRLDQCAVTFLMGCSSGCLTEAGELEPYGTPINYMHAGSPALVATLWDVTDKDIDRFAKSTFEQWGLIHGDLPEEEDPKGREIKSKTPTRKPTAKDDLDNGQRLALDEAVAKSRDSCVLKYLNGAAPVIYGIPVYLSAEA